MCFSMPNPPKPQQLPPAPQPPDLRIKGKENSDQSRLRAARGRNALRTDSANVGLAIPPK